MIKKQAKTIEVMVVLTPEQLLSLYKLHPNEFSFTRQLVTWDLSGRKRVDRKARQLQADHEKLMVVPVDDDVPAFTIQAK